ncbi:hypothetical protein A4R44_06161 [Amycolatopsis sp. M39]|nr:hypothetical protein A4R44_06161 [Amycolatopsis sp. M39]
MDNLSAPTKKVLVAKLTRTFFSGSSGPNAQYALSFAVTPSAKPRQ